MKTDWNCRLHRLALAGVSVKRVSFSFRGGMPSWSPFEFLERRKVSFCHKCRCRLKVPRDHLGSHCMIV